MTHVGDKEILNRTANEQLLVARQLASSRNFGGGLVSENQAVFEASLMHIASARQASPQVRRELLEGLGRFHRPSLPLVRNPNLETDLSFARNQANFSGAVLPEVGTPFQPPVTPALLLEQQAVRPELGGLGNFNRPSWHTLGNPDIGTDPSFARHQANFSGALLPGVGMTFQPPVTPALLVLGQQALLPLQYRIPADLESSLSSTARMLATKASPLLPVGTPVAAIPRPTSLTIAAKLMMSLLCDFNPRITTAEAQGLQELRELLAPENLDPGTDP